MAKKEKEVVEETPKVEVKVEVETVDPEVPENKQRWLR